MKEAFLQARREAGRAIQGVMHLVPAANKSLATWLFAPRTVDTSYSKRDRTGRQMQTHWGYACESRIGCPCPTPGFRY